MQEFHGVSTKRHEIARAVQEVIDFLDRPKPFFEAALSPT
jgi:hypothetical protein